MVTRAHSLVACLLAMVLAVATTAGAVGAGAVKTHFTGSEVFVADLEPGSEFLAGGRYQFRDGVSQFRFTADDPRLDSADNVATVHWSFTFMPEPVFVSGRMWGKFTLTNAGGAWYGTWDGVRDANGYSYFHFVGQGSGGYDGLQLRMWGARETPDPTQPEIYHGVILDPGG
jgi:hypothetical protein